MNDLHKCPPCHGDCNQGRTCNRDRPVATMMLEVNRVGYELEQANKRLMWIKNHAPLTYQAMQNEFNLPK